MFDCAHSVFCYEYGVVVVFGQNCSLFKLRLLSCNMQGYTNHTHRRSIYRENKQRVDYASHRVMVVKNVTVILVPPANTVFCCARFKSFLLSVYAGFVYAIYATYSTI